MASAEQLPPPGARSTGVSYQELLKTDTKPVPQVFGHESPADIGPLMVPRERFISREFHDLEMEKMWTKVWQMACREEEIPEPGDHVVYDIGDHSLIVVRAPDRSIKAFHNACLHRGRQLREYGGNVPRFRCPFHGWTWNLDGTLRQIPCGWDFPHVEKEKFNLPEARTGTWGGFVFINMDAEAESLDDYVGDLSTHFERWPLEERYKEVHVEKRLRCNWKVAQDAFMEAYHVIATHPQLLASIGDCNSQYDVYGNFSRAITPNGTPSPHITWESTEQEMLDVLTNTYDDEESLMAVPEGMKARAVMAQAMRMQLQRAVPGVHDLCDAELLDSFYYTLFPNFHPWAAYNRITYRFKPYENDPDRCTMEVLYLMPFRGKRPPPCEITRLDFDEPWTNATELGFLARVFEQDTFNLPKVQRGLHASVKHDAMLARYQETKLRHFHGLLERYVEA
jgi:phenylpropionate dioxygenase-like ring-hydroxylating dioxygenase large terminal subunit